MAKFCGKCGTKLDETTGLCPKCDADKLNKQTELPKSVEEPKPKQDMVSEPKKPLSKKEAKKQRKADKKAAKKNKKAQKKAAKKAKKKEKWAKLSMWQKVKKVFIKLLMMGILVALLGCVAIGGLSYCGFIHVPFADKIIKSIGLNTDSGGSVDEYRVNAPDAKSYYEDNSNIIAEINVCDSNDVLTEEKVYTDLVGRGFDSYQITTEYTMEGKYSEATEISDSSSEMHPIYQTYYVSSKGELWTIFVINDAIMANPVSYNIESGRDIQVIISESEIITSYDSSTGKFYETIPDDGALDILVVDKIDAKTLDFLTIGEIDSYE